MKILHTSDWHLGRMIYGRSLLDDQTYFIDRIFFPALEEHRPDCVILAGDIFDRQIAPVEALRLFDSVLNRLHQMGIPLAAISGNHDGADRLATGTAMLRQSGIYLATRLEDLAQPLVLEKEGERAQIFLLPYCDPVHEISVIPRGRAAGYTMTMPEDDRDHMSRGKILDEIAMALGGRVAESIFLDDICTGAYSDLQKATELARRMVVEFGMSDEIGPVFLGGQTEVFIAKDWGHQRNFSEEVAARVDKEIRRILEEQYDRAKTVLTEHRDAMERIVKALIEYEHIDGDDFEKLFKGEDVELETFSDRRARIEKADEEVLAKRRKPRPRPLPKRRNRARTAKAKTNKL